MGWKVYKLDPSDMSEVSHYEGMWVNGLNDMVYNGGFLYVARINFAGFENGGVDKITAATMALADAWNVANQAVTALDFDGTYILAGLDTDPGDVVRINPATMAEVDRWTGAAGQTNVRSITHDGTYYYALLDGAVLVRIDPVTMTTVESVATISEAVKIRYLNSFIYVTGATIPGVLAKIDPSDLSTVVDSWTDENGNPAQCVESTSPALYVGTLADPGEVAEVGPESHPSSTIINT